MYRVVVGFVSSVAGDLGMCPLVMEGRSFRKEKNVRGMSVQQDDHIRKRGAIGFHFLCVEGENSYLRHRRRMWRGGGGGCAPASDFGIGRGVWFLGLAHVAVSVSSVMGESCVSVLDLGLAGDGMCGQLSRLGDAGGE